MIEGERLHERSTKQEQWGIALKDCSRKLNSALWHHV